MGACEVRSGAPPHPGRYLDALNVLFLKGVQY